MTESKELIKPHSIDHVQTNFLLKDDDIQNFNPSENL